MRFQIRFILTSVVVACCARKKKATSIIWIRLTKVMKRHCIQRTHSNIFIFVFHLHASKAFEASVISKILQTWGDFLSQYLPKTLLALDKRLTTFVPYIIAILYRWKCKSHGQKKKHERTKYYGGSQRKGDISGASLRRKFVIRNNNYSFRFLIKNCILN